MGLAGEAYEEGCSPVTTNLQSFAVSGISDWLGRGSEDQCMSLCPRRYAQYFGGWKRVSEMTREMLAR
jgi:hypothetical protein